MGLRFHFPKLCADHCSTRLGTCVLRSLLGLRGFFVALSYLRREQRKNRMMAYVRRRFPDDRVSSCGVFLGGRAASIDLYVSGEGADSRTSAVGLSRCGDSNVCPNCASVRAYQDAESLRLVYQKSLTVGDSSAMVTFTHSHHIGVTYADELAGQKRVMARMKSGRAWVAFKKRHGLIGQFARVEVTDGVNGWHVHEHWLAFFSGAADMGAVKSDLYSLYAAALASEGFTANESNGVHVDSSRTGVADYVAKGAEHGWDAPAEATGAVAKRSRRGRTQWQLLEDAEAGEAQAARRFDEYARYWLSHQHASSRWSPQLFKHYMGYARSAPPEDVRASEAAAAALRRGRLVASVSPSAWWLASRVPRGRGTAVLLWLATLDDGAARVSRFCAALERKAADHSRLDAFRQRMAAVLDRLAA